MADAKDAEYYRELVKRMADRVDDAAVLRRVWRLLEQARIGQ